MPRRQREDSLRMPFRRPDRKFGLSPWKRRRLWTYQVVGTVLYQKPRESVNEPVEQDAEVRGLGFAVYEGAQRRAGFEVFELARERVEALRRVGQQGIDQTQLVVGPLPDRLVAHIAFVLKTLFALISPESRLKR